MNADQWRQKANLSPHGSLVEAFLELLREVGLIKGSEGQGEKLEDRLNLLLSKPVAKTSRGGRTQSKAAPSKKKAPPPKKASVAKDVCCRYPLFWPQTQDAPPSTASYWESVPPILTSLSTVFDSVAEELESGKTRAHSVYMEVKSPSHSSILAYALQVERVDRWFMREKQKKTEEATQAAKVLKVSTVRPACLSNGMCQRVGIMIHSLRKALGPGSTLREVKKAILECYLPKDGIALLADTVPNADDAAQCRKAEEWFDEVKAVEKLLFADPDCRLHDEESFVLFLHKVPKLHRRLGCMYVMAAFDCILDTITSRLEVQKEALDILIAHGHLPVLWQILLRLGNMLNEGTPRADLKWFKLSGLRRVLDVRGNEGMTLTEYLAAFVGRIFTSGDWRRLVQAKEAGVVATYLAARDMLQTILIITGQERSGQTEMPPEMAAEDVGEADLCDNLHATMKDFCGKKWNAAERLARTFTGFVGKYVWSAYYFGDPMALLPLDTAADGDPENEESAARDLLTRIIAFTSAVRAKSAESRIQVPREDWGLEIPPSPTSQPLATPRMRVIGSEKQAREAPSRGGNSRAHSVASDSSVSSARAVDSPKAAVATPAGKYQAEEKENLVTSKRGLLLPPSHAKRTFENSGARRTQLRAPPQQTTYSSPRKTPTKNVSSPKNTAPKSPSREKTAPLQEPSYIQDVSESIQHSFAQRRPPLLLKSRIGLRLRRDMGNVGIQLPSAMGPTPILAPKPGDPTRPGPRRPRSSIDATFSFARDLAHDKQ